MSQGYPRPLLTSPLDVDPDAQILDSRRAADFEAGHIPGAINVSWRDLAELDQDGQWTDAEALAAAELLAERGLRAGVPVVVYDEWSSSYGGDGYLYWTLRHLGADQVTVLDGGWDGWLLAQGALHVDATAGPGDFELGPGSDNLATTEQVHAAVDADSHVILDVRSRVEFLAGHIPGAVHLDYASLVQPDGRIEPHDVVLERLAEAGVTDPEQPVITYCAGGIRAGHTYFVLELMGYDHVQDYVGSWSAWDGDVER